MSKKNQRLRDAKTDLEKLALAMDEIPGGKFDDEVANALLSLRVLNDPKANIQLPDGETFDWKAHAKNDLFKFGRRLAEAMERNDSNLFCEIASTLDAWRDHTPRPDNRRVAFIEIVRLHKANQMQAGRSLPLSMRTIIKYMVGRGAIPVWPKEADYINLATTIRRWASGDGIEISGKAGNPQLRQKHN